ncbi:MAG: hypothetical protein CVU40_17170 [Chloroflexi bacterium HGW-Chloroflexi-2]|jgi:DNA-binding GntR family transcriptional regulator|nr:MAG: hypothetical protein CVU40_17170 [Chloroflexi bacterium HGW-Chloroflexi-2]
MNLQTSLISKNPLRDSVFNMLEESIIKLLLKPGDRLIETEISEKFGVSRGPIREAIQELEGRGLVEHIPYKGAVVSQLTEKDIEELRSCRMVVEKLAAKLIIEKSHNNPSLLEEFDQILDEMKEANRKSDLSYFLTLDFQFHESLVVNSNNHLLNEMWKPISSRLRRYFFLNSRQGYISLNESLNQHIEIISAIKKGDIEKTSELLNKHKCWS